MRTSYYDSIAKGYDELHKGEQLRKLNIIIDRLKEHDLGNNPVLDVGCGTGFSLDILKKELQKKCIGIDPSRGMLEQYKGSCKIIEAAAEDIPFPDKYFSAVVSITAVQNFSDIQKGIQEILRVTDVGGTVMITCLKKSDKLKIVAEELAETSTVLEVIEEEKDIIFHCRVCPKSRNIFEKRL